MSKLAVVIHGAAGRMGRRLVALAAAREDLRVVAALEHDRHPDLGRDAGVLAGTEGIGIPVSAEWTGDADVMIDFSTPDGAMRAVAQCESARTPLVMATTGLDASQAARVGALAEGVPVVWAPNMSLAVNLVWRLAQEAARTLRTVPGGVDVDIIERHHRYKEDAPSGTALRFGELLAEILPAERHVHGREGACGARRPGEIGYHALRVGDNPGEHTVVFGMLGETVELTVRATNRDGYAQGALEAARFVASREPGLYSMFDVLGW